jgi:3-deoxy-D-manno-octulosonate 8-phosphate phosphatase (KDO 8-P phosphatase)
VTPTPLPFAAIRLLGVDIDGTLTDGFLYWAGPEVGWTQRYAVRDGEALLRLVAAGIQVVPISRNKTACAKARMQGLKLPISWVGVDDKVAALAEVAQKTGISPAQMAYIGDGYEDVPILGQVALGCVPQNGHAQARAAADYVTTAPGGQGAVEEVIEHLLAAQPA